MSSSWAKQIAAVFRKEAKIELRTLSGITTTAMLCFVSIVVANSITWTTSINPLVAAGLYWMILIFAASVSLTRTFIQEEEAGNSDFWRLTSKPEAVFMGKALFNSVQMIIATSMVSLLFVPLVKVQVENWWLYIGTGICGSIAIAATATLAGAIAAPSNNRYALAAAISVPLLVFLANLGVTATATAFGEALPRGELGGPAMLCYAIASMSIGPGVYSKIWKG
jgi:heme exporter protein B